MKFSAKTIIDADIKVVWAVLLRPEEYPEWDPYCDRIVGQLIPGQKINVYSKLAPGRAFPVKVVELVDDKRMTWMGGMPLGLFKGVRTFSLNQTADGKTEFELEEVFSGLLLKLIGRTIPDMTEPFEAFAKGLKEKCESGATILG